MKLGDERGTVYEYYLLIAGVIITLVFAWGVRPRLLGLIKGSVAGVLFILACLSLPFGGILFRKAEDNRFLGPFLKSKAVQAIRKGFVPAVLVAFNTVLAFFLVLILLAAFSNSAWLIIGSAVGAGLLAFGLTIWVYLMRRKGRL